MQQHASYRVHNTIILDDEKCNHKTQYIKNSKKKKQSITKEPKQKKKYTKKPHL